MSTSTSTRSALTFLGAAGTVTGSKFLVETDGARLLIDCGLFQGPRQWRRRNWDPPAVEPSSLDAVVLTHAHLDHCGYLPLLVRHGFTGPVVCSPGTAALAAIVLRDAAHLEELEAEYARRDGYSKHSPALPLFDTADAERAITLLHPHTGDDPVPLPGGANVSLHPSAHILGSTFAVLDAGGVRTLFTGDMGRPVHPLLTPPAPAVETDVVVTESTYGARSHAANGRNVLAAAITATARRGGVCLLPAFAVDRTPSLMMILNELMQTGAIPSLPVHVDSPMALRALEVYRRAAAAHDPQLRPEVTAEVLSRVHLDAARGDSERLNRPSGPCVVISASGMATGGRVLHHLAAQLPDPRNTVLLTGYQVPGTRGAALADGAHQVKIHGEYVPVRAQVVVVDGFSAHADAEELIAWFATVRPPRAAYVVHGEPDSAATFAARLGAELGWNAVVPAYREKVALRARER
ncbi:MAG: MBL fold metallo-hydrolase [Cellulomonas sp.]|nr:MBL fold metallo-hydrolase [Cellulomonas sp.]